MVQTSYHSSPWVGFYLKTAFTSFLCIRRYRKYSLAACRTSLSVILCAGHNQRQGGVLCRVKAKKLDRAVAKLPSIPKELVEQFLTGPMTGEAINAAGLAFKQALIEASLNAELTHHLGYPPGAERPEAADQPAQRRHRQDGSDRRRQAADRDAARPRRQLRAVAAAQARASVHRLRRQHRRLVCARPDGARDPGLSGRRLRHRG